MQYMLLIHQGTSPTPHSPEDWARLSEDEQRRSMTRTGGSTKPPSRASPG